MSAKLLRIQLLLKRLFSQYINVDKHCGTDQRRNHSRKKDRVSVKKGVKKYGDPDADSNVDDAADFEALTRLDPRDPLLLTQKLDRGGPALARGLGDAPDSFGLVERFALLAPVIHPGGCGKEYAEERHCADCEKNPHPIRHQNILGIEKKLEYLVSHTILLLSGRSCIPCE
ncbi:MAG: hypothetical protein ACXVZR_15410 [Terriglobales bacterium]